MLPILFLVILATSILSMVPILRVPVQLFWLWWISTLVLSLN